MNDYHVVHTQVLSKLLSKLGKRIFFPQGIVAQTEQSQSAKIKATAGMAFQNAEIMTLPEFKKNILDGFSAPEAVIYAPVAGIAPLRKKWKEHIIERNPSINADFISTPIITSGLTQGVSGVLHLFLDEGDTLISPDCFWENYQHIAETVIGASIESFPMFDGEENFNLKGLESLLQKRVQEKRKAVILFNFPNNPTGYSLRKNEVKGLLEMLHAYAKQGVPILPIMDDAYFGLFYEDDVYQESLFAQLSQLHSNVFAIKIDGATKELLLWGLRVGFFTFGSKDISPPEIKFLEQKMVAYIRATVTSASRMSQTMVLRMLQEESLPQSITSHRESLRARYVVMKKAIGDAHKKYPHAKITPAPCNSGYFVSFYCESDVASKKFREAILEGEDIALISIDDKLRFTFSCVDEQQIPSIIHTIYKYTSLDR